MTSFYQDLAQGLEEAGEYMEGLPISKKRKKGFRGYNSFKYWFKAKVRNTWDFFRYDIHQGIGNLITWFPIIWQDRDWDWEYLATMMEKKLRHMYELETRYGYHTTSKRDARNQLICATLLKRLMDDNYFKVTEKVYGRVCTGSVELASANQKHEQELLGKIIGKYLTHWWD